MNEFIPFTTSINREDNMVYRLQYKGSSVTPYDIKVVIDELDDDKIVEMSCTCAHFMFRKEVCKHIQKAIEELKKFGVVC